MRLRSTLQYWWRRLRGRCVACGGAELPARGLFAGVHPHWCHWCCKAFMHATNYGMAVDYGIDDTTPRSWGPPSYRHKGD